MRRDMTALRDCYRRSDRLCIEHGINCYDKSTHYCMQPSLKSNPVVETDPGRVNQTRKDCSTGVASDCLPSVLRWQQVEQLGRPHLNVACRERNQDYHGDAEYVCHILRTLALQDSISFDEVYREIAFD